MRNVGILRRMAAVIVFVPVVMLVVYVLGACLFMQAVRWLVTGKSFDDDPMPMWLVPVFKFPFKLLGLE